ncbi:MAG TPA: class I adenylate-forming enzyme family protein [Oscillospiraceae bacterium]|nr:class I adenylate-forming enzyme family protein [Oscillospiraceae bacterium]HPF55427.1 class I adenylate-forming enzyme family protein [Clostridiales bacterium]HPK34463.1 class I adenylate-forming enzyme family protein [Oscillospiraceae bacterium]HPR76289.1 class I adenylate-forming enzyme family protein [Oscillospiraceae bacterium]
MDSRTYFKNLLDEGEFEKLVYIPTISGLLCDSVKRFGDREAVAWEGHVKTYRELDADVAAARGFLLKNGVKPGDHLAFAFVNEYNFVRFFFAATTLGCVAVLVPVQLPPPAMIGSLKKFQAKMLLFNPEIAASVEPVKAACPDVKFFNAADIEEDLAQSEKAPAASRIEKSAPAVIIFTGGTTGMPKGALLSHGALMRGAQNGAYGLGKAFFHRYYAMIPFIHVFGLVRNLLTACYTGSLLYLCANMKAFMKDLPAAKPDTMVLVPALAELLYTIASAYGLGALGGNLKCIICGGAPVSPDLIAKFDKLGVAVCPGYGLTETANLVSGSGDFLTHPDSVGMPYPNQELKLVDGELWLKGDNLFDGYYNDPEATAAAFGDGWFKTGDLAKFDEDGRLYIIGRTKNLIILDNGENVSPEELEALVNAIPFVRDCLVYEDKNDFGAQVIAVEVLPHENIGTADGIADMETAFKAALVEINRNLPRYMQIDKFTIRTTDFQRSGSMKIIRKAK